jgi:hypothetical protein
MCHPALTSRFVVPAALLLLLLLAVACGPEDPEPEPEPEGPDLFARPGPGEVVAGFLGEDGPFADHDGRSARPGDVLLKNDRVWFVVAGADRLTDWYVPYGGGLLDGDLVRDEGDPDYVGIDEFHPMVSTSPLHAETITVINDGTDGEPAVVRVVGQEGVFNFVGAAIGITPPQPRGLQIEVDYILAPDVNALEIVTRVFNDSASSHSVEVGDFVILGDDEADPFTLPGGFDRTALATRPVALGSTHDLRPWALAIYGDDAPLEIFGGDLGAQLFGARDSTIWLYNAATQLLRGGEEMEARRFVAIDRDASAALSGRIERFGLPSGTVTGRVLEEGAPVEGARVSFLEAEDAAVFAGQALTDADGRFTAQLPPGSYTAWPTAEGRGEHVKVPGVPPELFEGRPPGPSVSLTVTAGGATEIDLTVGRAGHVRMHVVDDRDEAIPAKITFIHEDGGGATAQRAVLGERRPYASRGFRKVFWTHDGEVEGEIRPGTYTVVASRGPTYETDVQTGVVVAAGATPTELSFALAKVVDTSDFVCMDSHLHAAPSIHGEASMAERLITNVAEGLDVHIATEHDRVIDYRPLVHALGLRPIHLSVPSNELSTVLMGHHNPWPLEPDPTLPNGGAAPWWGMPGDQPMTLDEAYAFSREQGARVVQVNHGMGSGGMFNLAAYDPATGDVGRPQYWSSNFNAMEVFNGRGRGGRDALLPIWFSFLNRGHRIAPTAVSDSHWRIPEPATGRSWVLTGEDDVAHLDADVLADAVLALRTVPSTGPLVRFRTEDGSAGMGDLVTADGAVVFAIEVQAPSWITLDRVELIANGEVIRTWEAGGDGWGDAPIHFATTTSVTPQEDTWYVVQVEGATEMGPVYPGLIPWAITSPIFVDADGNGQFDPPW